MGRFQNFKRASKLERTYDGIVFDSKGELNRYARLKMLERIGTIADLKLQVKFPLILPNGVPVRTASGKQTAVYTCDFTYTVTATGENVVEDYKGTDDPTSALRRAVAEAIYGFKIKVTSGKGDQI